MTSLRSLLAAAVAVLMILSTSAALLAHHHDGPVTLSPKANFRDLGGVSTKYGPIRHGVLYRSAALCVLNAADTSTVGSLHIKTVLDFRLPDEAAKQGLDPSGVGTSVNIPLDVKGATSAETYYRGFLADNRAGVKRVFGILADAKDLPVLYHCASGKDRTGIVTALVLMSLGTPRDTITADYLKSRAAGEVKKQWLDLVYASVDQAGGIDRYLDSCGVTSGMRASVARNLTGKS